jgi:hypothetical protein
LCALFIRKETLRNKTCFALAIHCVQQYKKNIIKNHSVLQINNVVFRFSFTPLPSHFDMLRETYDYLQPSLRQGCKSESDVLSSSAKCKLHCYFMQLIMTEHFFFCDIKATRLASMFIGSPRWVEN